MLSGRDSHQMQVAQSKESEVTEVIAITIQPMIDRDEDNTVGQLP